MSIVEEVYLEEMLPIPSSCSGMNLTNITNPSYITYPTANFIVRPPSDQLSVHLGACHRLLRDCNKHIGEYFVENFCCNAAWNFQDVYRLGIIHLFKHFKLTSNSLMPIDAIRRYPVATSQKAHNTSLKITKIHIYIYVCVHNVCTYDLHNQ